MKKSRKNSRLKKMDLEDPERDQPKLEGDQATLDLPEMKDISARANDSAPYAGLGDETISSEDEEGESVLSENEDLIDKKSNVGPLERKLIDSAFEETSTEEEPVDNLSLDDKDDEGDPLNEKSLRSDLFGEDLDSDLTDEEKQENDEQE
ncbi:MAG: hypothetical protein C5B59_08970 [Bacteroidetes bacterium]|nr:MAG: hypothetical protein C5B59_08970 [Bacteroidota bacterium]